VTQTDPAAQSWLARQLSSRWHLQENLSPRASSILVLQLALTQALPPVVPHPLSGQAPLLAAFPARASTSPPLSVKSRLLL
jgi:hypothetical protein